MEWKTDDAGLRHCVCTQDGTVYDAAAKCLDTRPARIPSDPDEPAWFWFAGTPAPVVNSDGVSVLVDRWHAWRDAHRAGMTAFLETLATFSLREAAVSVTQLPNEVPAKRLCELGRGDRLDADAIAAYDYGTERLWILPPGRWDCDYVLRTGIGMRTKKTGITRHEAKAWLERAGLPVTYLPEEPST